MIKTVAGRHNHSLKLARKLLQKKHRRDKNLVVCEGFDLLAAACSAQARITEVLVRDDMLPRLPSALRADAEADRLDIGVCPADLLDQASSLGGAADVITIAQQPVFSLAHVDFRGGVAVYLHGVGDPGNVGTIARSAVAFGAMGLVCGPGTADPFGPKAMRAGMGAQFLLPLVIDVTPDDLQAKLAGSRVQVLVADSRAGVPPWQVEPLPGTVLVLGAERSGTATCTIAGARVNIPQRVGDSLNVAMAGTILLYELTRRSAGPVGGKRDGRPLA